MKKRWWTMLNPVAGLLLSLLLMATGVGLIASLYAAILLKLFF